MKTSKAFRLSDQAIKRLKHIQKLTGMNQTAIVEMAIASLDAGLTKGVKKVEK